MAAVQRYKVRRPFNNNVLLAARVADGHEVVLIGKGIGFGQKSGALLSSDDSRIEKTFLLENETYRKQYHTLLDQVEDAVIGVSEEIIGMIAVHLTPRYNEHIHIALPDHISFAIHRLNNGMEIVNPFLYEIETLYPKEFELAEKSADLVEKRLGIKIPESEIGFLALHIHSAVSQTPVSQAVRFADLIRDILELARSELNLKLTQGSRDYIRFITHLRFALERVKTGKTIENPLLGQIQIEFPAAYDFAEQIGKRIEEVLQAAVPLDEIGYIAMHVHRLIHYRDTYG
jgi:transcriptional antiterminator